MHTQPPTPCSALDGILQHHGGRLAVESRPGEGTRFTLRLPLEEVPLSMKLPAEPSAIA